MFRDRSLARHAVITRIPPPDPNPYCDPKVQTVTTTTDESSLTTNPPFDEERRARLHPSLLQLHDELARTEGYVDSDVTWIEFLAKDAYIFANVKDGGDRVRIRATFFGQSEDDLSDDDVIDWVESQPAPKSGVLQALYEEVDDETDVVVPRLVFERPVVGFSTDHILDDLRIFADAWDSMLIADAVPAAAFEKGDPSAKAPQNAWLLMGDEASYQGAEDLEEARDENAAGIYDYLWTAPKNGALGDLAVVYYITPKKAACFVARFASSPFWTAELEVNAKKTLESRQWWTHLTRLIEIEPIPYRELQRANDGFLLLRGRSGHFLSSTTFDALTFTATHPHEQEELDRVVQRPTGSADLPIAGAVTFAQWTGLNPALLALEANVSQYVVEPLQRMLSAMAREHSLEPLEWAREYRVPAGYIDFLARTGASQPLAAIEVKLTIRRASTGTWADSPDFRQLRRYMDDLDVPGILLDSRRILLVARGADYPYAEILRANATTSDLESILNHVTGSAAV